MFGILPENNLWNSVDTDDTVERRPVLSALCTHRRQTLFTRIDHKSNPPPYQDCYKGRVCRVCGKVLWEEQTF